MIMGIIILQKTYTFSKYLSVFMISIGIALCTIVSGQDIKSTQTVNVKPTTPWDDFFWWTVGIILLTVALFISARMGLYQEVLYKRYGKHPKEALFYTVRKARKCSFLKKINLNSNFSNNLNSNPV